MVGNPLVDQGTLNRIRGTVIIVNNPALNVTAPYLGKEGISLALEGAATTFIDSMTGAVTSPEPYQACSCTVSLLKTQNLSALYKAQMELTTLLGPISVTPDSATLPVYDLLNVAIMGVRELRFNGEDAGWVVSLRGYYIINNALWNQ